MAVNVSANAPCDLRVSQEILPDGTIHHKMILRRNSLPSDESEGSTIIRSEILETFEQPPYLVQDFEELEEILPDGSKSKRRVSMNRMVHMVKTHHESFDEGTSSTKLMEDYELEEVIPGTVSAFDAGVDSDYEEELTARGGFISLRESQPCMRRGSTEIEEVLPDGTKVKKTVVLNQVVHTITTRHESFDKVTGSVIHKDYSVEEVIPNTSSVFDDGADSEGDTEKP